jgi:hypothetical protein
MPLVSENVIKNAEKCKQFVSKMLIDVNKQSIIDEQKEMLAKTFFKAMCKVAPYRDDFEKVYGKTPYDYFTDPGNQVL